MNEQQGYLIIAGAILLIIVSVSLGLFAAVMTTSSRSTTQSLQASQAFYVAEGGMEKAIYDLENGSLNCTNNNTQTASLGPGEYLAQLQNYQPNPNFKLSASISSSTTVIPVSTTGNQSIADMAPSGRVTIGSELIEYGALARNNSNCNGNPPCLIGAVRGAQGTPANSHSANDAVEQDQYFLWVTGSVPNSNTPQAQRVQGEAVYFTIDKFAVGQSPNKVLKHDACRGWREMDTNINYSSSLNDIACQASGNDCFAVGQEGGKILHWNGAAWESQSVTNIGALKAIDCGSDNACWAISDNSSQVLKWTGTNWSNNNWSTQNLSGSNRDLSDISCNNAGHCYAVGGKTVNDDDDDDD